MNRFLAAALLALSILTSFPTQSFAALTDNLLSYWKFDEASGNAADSSGAGRTLTNNNTIPYVAGKINNAADIELSSTQYFSRANDTGIYDAQVGTVNCWVRAESLNNSSGIVETTTNSGSGGFYLDARADGSIRLGFGGGSNQATAAAGALTTATYYMVTGTWNLSRKEIFKNAVSVAANETDETIGGGTASFIVGRNAAVAADYWDGHIDECGFWTRVLSGAEITELYNAGAGLTYPFVAPTPANFGDVIFFE